MYARVITLQVQPAKVEEMIRFFQKCIMPAGQQQPGFEGSFLLTDGKAGKVVSMAFWQTKSEMCAFDTDCLAQLTAAFATFLDAPPVVEIYSVPLRAGARLAKQPVLQFGETALGIRIENPCEEELNRTSGSWERLQS